MARFVIGTFAKNSAILFAGTMAANILNYVFHLALGRIASVELYGEIESLISLMHIISVPAMTLTIIATKYAAHARAENDTADSRALFQYLVRKTIRYALPLLLVAFLATPFVADFLKIENRLAIAFIWISMAVLFFGSINNGILTGWQKFKESGILLVVGTAVKLIAGVALVAFGFGLSGAVGSFVLSGAVAYAVSLVMLRFILSPLRGAQADADFTHPSAELTREMDPAPLKKYILPALFGTLSLTILGSVDMVFAKHNLDAVAAGQFGALTVVSKVIFFATGIIATVMFSMSAEDNHKKKKSLIILRNALILTGLAAVCATIIYFLFPKFVLTIFFGDKYFSVAPYLGWFAAAVSLYSFVNLLVQYLLSIHRTKTVYAFLGIALAEMAALFLWGTTIYAILQVVIFAQVAAVCAGVYFIFFYGQNNIRRHSRA